MLTLSSLHYPTPDPAEALAERVVENASTGGRERHRHAAINSAPEIGAEHFLWAVARRAEIDDGLRVAPSVLLRAAAILAAHYERQP